MPITIPPFINMLEQRLTLPLPGIEVQKNMAPIDRASYEKIKDLLPQYKQGAVLIHLCLHLNEWYIVFIKRSTYDGIHSGQMAFPGGKHDPVDATYEHTAMREAHEEVHLPAENISIIGSLSTLHIPVSKFSVRPYISWQYNMPKLIANKTEVSSIHMLPLSSFYNDGNIVSTEVMVHQGARKTVPAFCIDNQIIWGATAMMMYEFVAITKQWV